MIEIVLYVIVALAFGGIMCFFGKKIYFPIIMIGSFCSCFGWCTNYFGVNEKGMLFGAVSGIILALLTRFVYKFGLFLLGGTIGILLGRFLLTFSMFSGMGNDDQMAVIVICAIVTGIIAVKLSDTIIMIFTAFDGAALISTTICFLFYNINKLSSFVYNDESLSTLKHLETYIKTDLINECTWVITGITIVLTIVGFVYQFTKNKK